MQQITCFKSISENMRANLQPNPMMEYPRSSHTWKVSDRSTVKRLNKGTLTDAIDSVVFPMLGCKWYLRFRPNGLAKGQHSGNAFLILHSTGLPPNRSSINFRYKLSLLETQTTYKHAATFHSDYLNVSWDKGCVSSLCIFVVYAFRLFDDEQIKNVCSR